MIDRRGNTATKAVQRDCMSFALVLSSREDELFIESVLRYSVIYDSSHMQHENPIVNDSIWKETSCNAFNSSNDDKKQNCSQYEKTREFNVILLEFFSFLRFHCLKIRNRLISFFLRR